MARNQPLTVQLARQCRLTLVLLPLVAGLPWVDDEALARAFGQAMLVLNWIPEAPGQLVRVMPDLSVRPRTKEEQRTYWREAQRQRRRRLKLEALEKERAEIVDRMERIRNAR